MPNILPVFSYSKQILLPFLLLKKVPLFNTVTDSMGRLYRFPLLAAFRRWFDNIFGDIPVVLKTQKLFLRVENYPTLIEEIIPFLKFTAFRKTSRSITECTYLIRKQLI